MLVILLCLACAALGIGATALIYEKELRRMARFLSRRDTRSNARVVTEMPGAGLAHIARAINDVLDADQRERIADMKRQQEFQRDLSALSHDIRTPLTGAKGRVQLAQDEDDADQRDIHLTCAVERIDEATRLINQLFAYTKATDPDLVLSTESVEVMPAVMEAMMRHQPAIEHAGWEPIVDFENESICIEANVNSLDRILDNLIDNAVKHGSSPLIVRQRGAALSFINDVSDPEAIDTQQLFERFYRADTARSAPGTGLGLPIAFNLARAMGMRLTATLNGSTLTITFDGSTR